MRHAFHRIKALMRVLSSVSVRLMDPFGSRYYARRPMPIEPREAVGSAFRVTGIHIARSIVEFEKKIGSDTSVRSRNAHTKSLVSVDE